MNPPFTARAKPSRLFVLGTTEEAGALSRALARQGPSAAAWQVWIVSPEQLPAFIGGEAGAVIVASLAWLREPAWCQSVALGTPIISLPALLEHLERRLPLAEADTRWMLEHAGWQRDWRWEAGKRCFDVLAAAVVLAALALLLAFQHPPARPDEPYTWMVGLWGRPVRVARPASAARRWVQSWWRVLVGEWSVVGPAPLPCVEAARHQARLPHFERRFCVRPGLCGWAQVHGATPWRPEALGFDLYYVVHRSVGLEAEVLFKTMAGTLLAPLRALAGQWKLRGATPS